MKYNTQAPYVAAYTILRNGGKVAFVLRQNTDWMNDHYGLPSGKIEWKESATAAAIREAKEEVGIDIQLQHLHHALTLHRHSGKTDWVDFYFEVAEWEGEVTNAEPHMHAAVAWLDVAELPDNVIPSVRFALEQIAAGKAFAEFGWEGENPE